MSTATQEHRARSAVASGWIPFVAAVVVGLAVELAFLLWGDASRYKDTILGQILLTVMGLIAFVIAFHGVADVLAHVAAKRKLIALFRELPFEQIESLRLAVLQGYWPPAPFSEQPLHNFPTSLREEFTLAWGKLAEFFRTDPHGPTAEAALFQRSPDGRQRYFDRVLQLSRR